MANPELDRLLVRNLGDAEAAFRHLAEVLQPAIAEALNERVKKAMSSAGWLFKAEYEDEIWIAPRSWLKAEAASNDEVICWFGLDTSDGTWDTVHFWLAALLGVSTRPLGMRWTHGATNRRIFRKRLNEQPEVISRLRSRGFEYQETAGAFFLPVRLDMEALAHAVGEESPDLALAPIDGAIQTCIDAKGEFDLLIEAAAHE